MPYIGNDIQFGELTSQTFTGDGSTVAFTMGYSVANTTSILVTSGNVVQEPTVAYTVSGTTLTFTSAPEDDDTIHVRFLGRVVDVANAAILQDSDQDTKIQVEESADEDTIRFDIAGAEDFTMTANTFTAASGSTIAAQALTATTIGSSAGVTITGTTPTLTIGDAGAEDTKIVFDGNAQDYRIGLDDGTDTLEVGLGAAHGTTPHMIFDANGLIRTPLQCSFCVILGSTQSNVTGDNTRYTVPFTTAEWDVNADFDLANNKFVCPVDGTYHFTAGIALAGIATDQTLLDAFFFDETDNWYQHNLDVGNVYNAGGNYYLMISASIKKAAGTDIIAQVQIANGSKVVDVLGASYPFTWMSGFLVG